MPPDNTAQPVKNGKWLEDFVASVEKSVGGKDIRISQNSKKFDENGTQLAEFDLIVSGKVGTADLNILIECRDRQGSAPASWIEQLIGRKATHGFDRVIAVSTSGFAAGAAAAAAAHGIELRTVHELTPEQLVGFLGQLNQITFKLQQLQINVHTNPQLEICPSTPEISKIALSKVLSKRVKFSDKWIFDAVSKTKVSFRDLWDRYAEKILGPTSDWDINETVSLDLPLRTLGEDLRILTSKGLVKIERIVLSADCWMKVETLDKKPIRYAKESGELIREEIRHISTEVDPSFSMSMKIVRPPGLPSKGSGPEA